MKPFGFIVVFDDEQGLCVPYTFDPHVDGAIEAASSNEPVAVFPTRAAALAARQKEGEGR